MAYTVNKTNGQTLTVLREATVDTKYGISLIGQNYHNYGELIANNFVRLLENSANSSAPLYSMTGQLWYDTDNKLLNYFDGTRYKPIASYTSNSSAPLDPRAGDQWYDTSSNQLKIYNGTAWVVIPTSTAVQAQIDLTLPKYAIIMWQASMTVPTGWLVCDGTYGTPNLYGKSPSNLLVFIMKTTG